jgi:hypothetical protein
MLFSFLFSGGIIAEELPLTDGLVCVPSSPVSSGAVRDVVLQRVRVVRGRRGVVPWCATSTSSSSLLGVLHIPALD